MAKKNNLMGELKALGGEIGVALKQMRSSKEFKRLEKDITAGISSISGSVASAMKAASKSKNTSRLKNQVGRVLNAGSKEGRVQALRAERLAAQKINEAAKAFRKITERLRKQSDLEG